MYGGIVRNDSDVVDDLAGGRGVVFYHLERSVRQMTTIPDPFAHFNIADVVLWLFVGTCIAAWFFWKKENRLRCKTWLTSRLAEVDDELQGKDSFSAVVEAAIVVGITLWSWGWWPGLPARLLETFWWMLPYFSPLLSLCLIVRVFRLWWLQRGDADERAPL
jgi:hypothetical protein